MKYFFLCILLQWVTIFLSTKSLNAQVNLNQGLVAYFPFSNNANDVSGNNNHGIVQNGVQLTTDRFGIANSAYLFDGVNDFITIPSSPSLNPSSGLSVAVFFYPTQSTVQTIIGKISYANGIGTQFQVGIGYNAYPGVFYGLNPPTTGCNNQISVNNAYINTGVFYQNQWNCLVASWENGIQKIYLNGVLIQTNNTGFPTLNQCTNSDIQIGSWWSFDPQRFQGKIDDVRIYNRALTDDEVAALCIVPPTVQPSFLSPDTVCINTQISLQNTSLNASSNYWNFCSAPLNGFPTGLNLGNPGGQLTTPCFIDFVNVNGNFHGFITSNNPASLVRLDFGNSLLNNPTVTNLGNFGNIIPLGAQGIQIIYESGSYYAIITGGDIAASPVATSRIVKIDFGSNITNNSPVITNWGNIGGLAYPTDLYMFKQGGFWYGFTVNYQNGTITRFNFGPNFNNPPTGVNLGSPGGLNQPNGLFPINDNGTWRLFVANFGNHTISRIDFGNSLLNAPTGAVNLGNISGALNRPRDIYIYDDCGEYVGFVINEVTNSVVKIQFSNLNSIPAGSSLGVIGGMSSPHSISKLFRSGPDLYAFVPNSYVNTISRIRFSGCNNSSIPNSTQQTPPPFSYNSTGTYTVNLTVDEGLPTQSSYCKKITVVNLPKSPIQTLNMCSQGSIKIGSSIKPANYLWNNGSTSDSILITTPGTYWVESTKWGCTVRDSFIVTIIPSEIPDFVYDQSTCDPLKVQFNAAISNYQSFTWNFGNGMFNSTSLNPIINYGSYANYPVTIKVTRTNGCVDSIQKLILIENLFDNSILANNDTTICKGDSLLLMPSQPIEDFCWATTSGQPPLFLQGYIHPIVPNTYTLTSKIRGANLLANPGFELGNSGFSSDHSFTSNFTQAGEYGIVSNPQSWDGNSMPCTDHTSTTGNMMVVAGSSSPGQIVWSQSVAINPNTNYEFGFWLSSLTGNPASLQLMINNHPVNMAISGGNSPCQWSKYGFTWHSESNTTAVISLLTLNTAGSSFALDDFFLGSIFTRRDSFSVNVNGLCDSIKISV